MKVKVNLSNQTLEYMDSQPYIQGTDTRNKLSVYIKHSTVPQTEGAFNIMIAYALQNGRTTIKMSNTGATQETIDDVLYDIFYFTAPKVLTSISGNFVATLILKVNSNTYKVNVLNTVLNAVDFEAFEDALDDVSSEFIETIEAMSTNITGLQTNKADRNNDEQTIVAGKVQADNIEDNDSGIDVRTDGLYIYNTNDLEYHHSSSDKETIEITATNNILSIQVNETDESEQAKIVMNGNSTDAFKFYTDDYLALTIDTDQHAIFESDIIVKGDLYFDTSYDYGLYKSGNGDFNINIPNNKKLTLNDVEISNKTYVDNADSGLQAQITALNNEIGYIELSGSSGTLTTDQYIEAQKKYCIIKRSHATGYSWYWKANEYPNSYLINFVKFGISVTSGNNNSSVLGQTEITINTVTKAYSITYTNDFPTYDSNVIDSKVTNLQSQIDGLNAGQNLADIVANLTALNNLDTTKLQSGDKVEVLSDSDHDNVSTVYNWNGTIWQYIGAYGMDAYTKAQMDSALALKQNVISSSNRISSDYVNDTNATNKFVTADEKQFWDAKQMALSDTDSIENVIWGDDDPNANYDIHVGVKVKDSYLSNFLKEKLGLSVVDGCLCQTYTEN